MGMMTKGRQDSLWEVADGPVTVLWTSAGFILGRAGVGPVGERKLFRPKDLAGPSQHPMA